MITHYQHIRSKVSEHTDEVCISAVSKYLMISPYLSIILINMVPNNVENKRSSYLSVMVQENDFQTNYKMNILKMGVIGIDQSYRRNRILILQFGNGVI